jgi:nitrogen fixation protein NifU and related proteins
MVGPRLRELLRAGEGAGDCTGAGVVIGSAEHPACGDIVQLSVRRENGLIHEVRWRAQACPATVAVAALAANVLREVPEATAARVVEAAIAADGGLAAHERHAAAIVLRALAAAVGSP